MNRDDAWTGAAIAIALAAAIAGGLTSGCRPAATKCPVAPPVEVVQVRVDCAPPREPAPPGPVFSACPAGAADCAAVLTRSSMERLVTYLAAVATYQSDVRASCGPARVTPTED